MIWVPRLGLPLVVCAFMLGGLAWLLAEQEVLAGALLLWPGMNLGLMGLGYLGLGARVWGKSPQGKVAIWSRLFWLPARWTMLRWTRWSVRKQDATPHQELEAGVWVGRRAAASNAPVEIASVLDLASEFPPALRPAHYLSLRMMDGAPPDPGQEERLDDFLREAPRPLLIHCGKGKGRTGTIALRWLMAQGLGFEEAIALAKKARPELRVQPSQRRWLAQRPSGQ